jgi:hypothetical protein
LQLDAWFERANDRTHKTLRARPIDWPIEERAVMRPLPDREPDLDHWLTGGCSMRRYCSLTSELCIGS